MVYERSRFCLPFLSLSPVLYTSFAITVQVLLVFEVVLITRGSKVRGNLPGAFLAVFWQQSGSSGSSVAAVWEQSGSSVAAVW